MAEEGDYAEPHSVAAEIVEDHVSDRKTYSLNPKRIVADQIFEIATLLDLPERTLVVETHQLIEGKLLELGNEPCNVQVVVQKETMAAEYFW